MAAFRDRNGNRIEVASVTATDAKNEFGRVLETALRDGAVVITKHETPRAVLLSWEEYSALAGAPAGDDKELASLSKEFDELYGRMQTSVARGAVDALFAATPEALGRAAARAARRKRNGKKAPRR